jgi:hypothetical protein
MKRFIFVAAVAASGCASSGPGMMTPSNNPTAIAPGMTRAQLVSTMGNPSGFMTGTGGFECLTFDMRQTPLAVSPMTMKQNVVLKDGLVVQSQTASPLASWGAPVAAGQQKMSCPPA